LSLQGLNPFCVLAVDFFFLFLVIFFHIYLILTTPPLCTLNTYKAPQTLYVYTYVSLIRRRHTLSSTQSIAYDLNRVIELEGYYLYYIFFDTNQLCSASKRRKPRVVVCRHRKPILVAEAIREINVIIVAMVVMSSS
jgi:hypothetical protein